jgi:hypothetical protein
LLYDRIEIFLRSVTGPNARSTSRNSEEGNSLQKIKTNVQNNAPPGLEAQLHGRQAVGGGIKKGKEKRQRTEHEKVGMRE